MSDNMMHRNQYKQVLSQVKFYMHQHNARHGFILTNAELVAVKRLDETTILQWPMQSHGIVAVSDEFQSC